LPPAMGVRATLATTGLSRVVVGCDSFQPIAVAAGPQRVALSSPRDASGLFELEPQSELLNPFEGLGVDAFWELRLPKPANLFDFNTVADVLVTIEYTALESYDYGLEVKASPALTRPLSLDRAYSLRYELADAWFELTHPEESTTPMSVSFETKPQDFAPNLDALKIQHVVLHFGGDDPKDDIQVNQL